MEGISILQLTSLTTVVTAAIFLTYVAKRALAEVPVASRVPVWVYTAVIAGVLTYIASRVTGTLDGQTGVLMVDAVINGALASGIREWFTAGTKPLAESGTAKEAILDRESGGLRSWLLPLLLIGSLTAMGCGGVSPRLPAPIDPAPTEAQIQAVRDQAAKLAIATKEAASIAVEARRLAERAFVAGVISRDAMLAINQAAIDVGTKGEIFVDFAALVTTEPSLRASAQALYALFGDYIHKLTAVGGMTEERARAIRVALAAFVAYLGLEDAPAAAGISGGVR